MKVLLVAVAVAMVGSSVMAATTFTCHSGDEHLDVEIVANYSPPLSFSFKAPSYRAGSHLTLSCVVEGFEDSDTGLFYEWTSTCKGNCFSRGGTLKTVSSRYLHSYDQGVHTCVVRGQGRCSGNASITVDVVGGGIYMESPFSEVLPNNSLIVALSSFARALFFRGLSGSNKSRVGQLIGPLGNDITHSYSNLFIISLGSSYDPGSMYVRCLRALRLGEVGVYTYRTPDEAGNDIDVNLGIYSSYASSDPVVTDLDFSLEGDTPFSLFCFSLNSPPTEILWEKDSEKISLDGSSGKYKTSQMLVNRITSAYVSTLTMDGVLEDVVAEYSCTVMNTIGISNTLSITIKPIEIVGHESPIIVGLTRIINCTTILNASKIEWMLVGVGNGEPVEESDDGATFLELFLTPEATELNGARFICQVTTVNSRVLEETVTVEIKELDHMVTIEDDTSPILVGGNATLVCAVICDFIPSIQWLDKDNDPVTIYGDSVFTDEPFTTDNTTYLYLNFNPVKSSHGGRYSCKSIVSYPPSTKVASRNVVIQLAPDSVSIIQSPAGQHFKGRPLTLTCFTFLDTVVDIAVQVSHDWIGPSGLSLSDTYRRSVGGVTGSQGRFESSLVFFSLQSLDSGNYFCSSVVRAETHSTFIASSAAKSTSVLLTAVIPVVIAISYSSPDPTYFPPNYRVATAITLTCTASSTTGYITYHWSSTCSNCFAASSSSSTISKQFLVARDAGVHICTVTDGSGDSGSNQTTMNIIGSGIYVDTSLGTGTGFTTGVQPDNSYAIVDTGYNHYYSYTRFRMYCCSNSSSSLGTIIFPDGVALSSGEYYNGYATRYTGSTNSYGGCIQFYYSYYYHSNFYLYVPGIYICSFGANQNTNIGLYSEGTSAYVTITDLQRSLYHGNILNIVCTTGSYPPTKITWYKDNDPLNTTNVSMTATITNQLNSSYDVTLLVEDVPDSLIGSYSVTVGNDLQTTNRTLSPAIRGLQMVCNNSLFIVGEAINCTCSSDLEPTSISWYRGGQVSPFCSQTIYRSNLSGSVYGSSNAVIRLGTEDHGRVYRCVSDTPYGSQEKSFEVQVEVPHNWATSTIPSSSALLNSNFILSCEVKTIPGLTLPVSIEWVFPNGTVITTQRNRTVAVTNSTLASSQMEQSCGPYPSPVSFFSLSMTFDSVRNSDGGTYTCRATIHVPWMRQQPQQLYTTTEMIVTTQALFQLKIYPVTHCSTWDVVNALELDASIKRVLEKAIRALCKCPFNSNAINSGEFSCQPRSCDSANGCGISTSAVSPVTYRAIINGTSSLLTADQVLGYIEEWRGSSGTLLHNSVFRLRLIKECSLEINSFDDNEC